MNIGPVMVAQFCNLMIWKLVQEHSVHTHYFVLSEKRVGVVHTFNRAVDLQMEDTEASADALLSASLEKGGKDNISFIILKLDRKEVEHDGR